MDDPLESPGFGFDKLIAELIPSESVWS